MTKIRFSPDPSLESVCAQAGKSSIKPKNEAETYVRTYVLSQLFSQHQPTNLFLSPSFPLSKVLNNIVDTICLTGNIERENLKKFELIKWLEHRT